MCAQGPAAGFLVGRSGAAGGWHLGGVGRFSWLRVFRASTLCVGDLTGTRLLQVKVVLVGTLFEPAAPQVHCLRCDHEELGTLPLQKKKSLTTS